MINAFIHFEVDLFRLYSHNNKQDVPMRLYDIFIISIVCLYENIKMYYIFLFIEHNIII